MFAGSVARSVDAPLRQGDVIESTNADATPWTRFLLVITADCDLANTKNAGRVTCVPLLGAEDYLVEFHFPERQNAISDRHVREFNDELRRNQRARSRPTAWSSGSENPPRSMKLLRPSGLRPRQVKRYEDPAKVSGLPRCEQKR